MGQSLSNIIIHIIFSTKDRYPFIQSEIEHELHAYMTALLKQMDCPVYELNGYKDHIHILCNLSRSLSTAKVLEKIKSNSSRWIKTKAGFYTKFQWQNGYSVFSISPSKLSVVRKYIQDQKEHHRIKTFQEEYIEFLKAYQIEYDERYIWN